MPFLSHLGPELIRVHPELAQNVTGWGVEGGQGTKKEKSAFPYSNELLQEERADSSSTEEMKQ